jgi:hypothetical protein
MDPLIFHPDLAARERQTQRWPWRGRRWPHTARDRDLGVR